MTGIESSANYDNAFMVVPMENPGPPNYEKPKTSTEEDTPKKKETIGSIVTDFGNETTAHGVSRITNASNCLVGLFWLIVLLGAFALFSYQGTYLVLDYLGNPYGTTIDVITKTNVGFPAVTVCNMNRLRRSKLVGTRFEGVIAIDGGISGGDADYSWFFDWSSQANWLDAYLSSGAGGGGGGRKRRAGGSSSIGGGGGSLGGGGGSLGGGGGSLGGGGGSLGGGGGGLGGGGGSLGGGGGSLGGGGGSLGGGGGSLGGGGGSLGGGGGSLGGGGGSFGGGGGSFGGGGGSFGGGGASFGGGGFGTPGGSFSFIDEWFTGFGSTDFQNFEYVDYYDFGDVTGESDWNGFLENSKSEDYSDIINVANPTREELDVLGHQAEDLILQCTFDKRPCNYTDFHKFQNSQFGNCFTYNHGRNETARETSKSGSQYGLHLTLFIEQPEYVGLFSPESGVRISVDDWQTTPNPEDTGLTASTGQATSIAIRKTFIDRLGGKYSNCTDGSDTLFESDFFTYSPLACKKQCMQRNLRESCGCVSDLLLEGEKCSFLNSTQQRCRQLVETLYEDDKLDCYCPVACEETGFQVSSSVAVWPSERYEEHLYSRVAEKNEVAARILQDVETTRKNMARLHIYFEELNYQSVTEVPSWTFESILGSVGGLMGLYVGISSITLFEIILFVLTIFKHCLKTVMCLNKVHPDQK
ncbi:uncharacterized protein LOC117303933 [Asterias rubens]|uniref:uncharacterized protein LOC117303933 n=1 Tax=Asterias rubens TaxID=7604 RepID=UPI00145508E6|nr:uncharacterized protein LOC117303933 [Asterias rubens]